MNDQFTVGSLFSGIGGFDLAAHWLGWRTAWFSEIDPYASAVLKKHWPHVPNHGDIKTLRGSHVERVKVLCGGFPCQDASICGKGKGLEGERSGLWVEYARVIGELNPPWVVIENVAALRFRGLDQVLRSLHALRYDAQWHFIPASYLGAPHRRDRIWIVGYPYTNRDRVEGRLGTFLQECAGEWIDRTLGASRATPPQGLLSAVRDTVCVGRKRIKRRTQWPQPTDGSWWVAEPGVGRVAYGVPHRVDRIKGLGNAVVPQVVYMIFDAIQRVDQASL